MNSYSTDASVTDMQEKLGWRSVEQKRAYTRLIMMYKIIHVYGYVTFPLPLYFQQPTWTTRHSHPSLCVKFTLLLIIISTRYFHWLLCSGKSYQQKLLSCLLFSKTQFVCCLCPKSFNILSTSFNLCFFQ